MPGRRAKNFFENLKNVIDTGAEILYTGRALCRNARFFVDCSKPNGFLRYTQGAGWMTGRGPHVIFSSVEHDPTDLSRQGGLK